MSFHTKTVLISSKEQFDIWPITDCQSVNDANFTTLNFELATRKY